MRFNSTEMSATARLFSSAVIRELARKGCSPLFRRLYEMSNLGGRCASLTTVGDVFEAAFARFKVAGLRDEYIYRAALTQRVLLGTHSLRTASMLTEFRAGSCKADLVILNGSSTAYEIKSERDSLTRLSNQVNQYSRVFASVNVIASEGHAEEVQAVVPAEVGVLCLSRRHQISTVREAVDRPGRVCPVTIFESLRTDEAIAILAALGLPIPEAPNTKIRGVLREQFSTLEPDIVHRQMVQTLKRTRNLAPLEELVKRLPRSMHAAILSIPLRRGDQQRLVQVVNTPLEATATWA